MPKTYANGRSILHKGDGNTHVSAAPDVCKVPTPGGPVPTPFVNSAQDSMLAQGSKTTKIDGNPVALSSSEISTSSGDEPGTAGGLISSKFKGKLTWGSCSVDVKVEGKGVVRFLDVTLHNGNTFNTAFKADGRTELAYGDDMQCTACGNPVEKHRIHETDEAVQHLDDIFRELDKRFDKQRPLIERYLALRSERNNLDTRSCTEQQSAHTELALDEASVEKMVAQLKIDKMAVDQNFLDSLKNLQNTLREKKSAIKKKRASDLEKINKISQEMKEINRKLQEEPVLNIDENFDTYTRGFMVGVCICKCLQLPKMLVACSGNSTGGFQAAVAATSFKHVNDFQMSLSQKRVLEESGRGKWDCAAPKLLQAGAGGGHKIRTMSERWYEPTLAGKATKGLMVESQKTDSQGTRLEKNEYTHGQSVPSCDICKTNLPEMLCDNHEECA